MKKPWEQEWRQEGYRWVEERDTTATVCMVHASDDSEDMMYDTAERSAFIAAAPDMARALLALGHLDNGEWHTAICWEYSAECMKSCRDAREALRKARALP